MKYILSLVSLLYFNTIIGQSTYFPDPDTAIQKRITEWQDLKFGLLLHWGTYSQWGIVESWSICPEDLSWATGGRKSGVADTYQDYVKAYENLKNSFNPIQFNPEKWASAAKQAGMKYLVFTTKHHDGFCMFDSKYTNYKVTDNACPFSTNPHSNITKSLFKAFRNEKFWIGAYFSKPDWHSDYYWWRKFPAVDRNPNYSIEKYPTQWKKFKDYTHNQIKELMTDYGKIDLLWLDGGWVRNKTATMIKEELLQVDEGSRWARNPQSQDIDMPGLVKSVRAIQPKVIVVDRAVPGEQQNYLTPEQQIPDSILPYPWETCMTMATSWSYVPGDVYKTSHQLVHTFIDIVSKGGNFLLNIGPSPTGELDSAAYQRLSEIGAWLKVNGEAIYGSRPYKVFKETNSIRYTQSKDGKTIYIFFLETPDKKILLTQVHAGKNSKLQLLGDAKKLSWKQTKQGLEIDFSTFKQTQDSLATVIKLEIE